MIALLEDGNKSDAQISREIKISKATAGRIRKKLFDDEIITDFLPIVNLENFGINLFVVVMFQWNNSDDEQLLKGLEKDPHVVYLATGDSSNGLTHVMMFGFFDMSEYHTYLKKFRSKYTHEISNINAFFIPSEKIIKQDYTGLISHYIKKRVEK